MEFVLSPSGFCRCNGIRPSVAILPNCSVDSL
jgi:hypothetical protein